MPGGLALAQLTLLLCQFNQVVGHNTTEFPNQPAAFQSQLCTYPLSRSIFKYQPSLPLNLLPLAFYIILAIGHGVRGAMNRTWTSTAAIVLGCFSKSYSNQERRKLMRNAVEVGGYVGRVT